MIEVTVYVLDEQGFEVEYDKFTISSDQSRFDKNYFDNPQIKIARIHIEKEYY